MRQPNRQPRTKPRQRRHRLDVKAIDEIVWIAEEANERERRAAVRTAISILAAKTQPGLLGPAARRGAAGLIDVAPPSEDETNRAKPISYVELAEQFEWRGFAFEDQVGLRQPQRAPLPMSDLLRQRSETRRTRYRTRRQLRRERRKAHRVNPQVRPGQGGRQPNASPFTIQTAASDLIESLGDPQSSSDRGAQILEWDAREAACEPGVKNGVLDPLGEGLILARLSGDEIAKGETLGWHVQSALAAPKRAGLRPRRVIASINNSGYRRTEDRTDVLRLEEAVEDGECAWVAVSFAGRLARGRLQIEEIYDLLRTAKVDLYVGEISRKVDWQRDDPMLAAWAMKDSLEGRGIKERTHGSIIRRYLLMGRGWPGSIRYGTMRAPDLYLVEDPEQMKVVHWLFERFEEIATSKEGGGLRRLRDELWETWGTRMSHERVRTILMDPLYVTGEWHVTFEGYAISCRPVEFSEPIGREQFQRVQELLALKSRNNRTTKLGEFLLNYVPFLFAPTIGKRIGPYNEQPLLRGFRHKRQKKGDNEGYGLRPSVKGQPSVWVPKAIEVIIVRELRRLLRSNFARAEAAKLGPGDKTEDPKLAAKAERERKAQERAAIETKLAEARTREQAARRRFLDQTSATDDQLEAWNEIVAEDLAERKRLERQLERLDRPRRRRRRRPRIGSDERNDYLASVQAILTEETPDDDDHRIARAALVQSLLSAVIIHEPDDEGRYCLELRGWIVPDGEEGIGDAEKAEDESGDAVGRSGNLDSGDGRSDQGDDLLVAPGIDPITQIKGHLERFAKGGMSEIEGCVVRPSEESAGLDDCVKQGTTCLTQSETQQLVDCLNRSERPPAELERAYVGKRGTRRMMARLISTQAWREAALTRAAFSARVFVDTPAGQNPDRAKLGRRELVPLSKLGNRSRLYAAMRRGALRTKRKGRLICSTIEWVEQYEASLSPQSRYSSNRISIAK